MKNATHPLSRQHYNSHVRTLETAAGWNAAAEPIRARAQATFIVYFIRFLIENIQFWVADASPRPVEDPLSFYLRILLYLSPSTSIELLGVLLLISGVKRDGMQNLNMPSPSEFTKRSQ